MSAFEHIQDIGYDWIYRFDPRLDVTECKFVDASSYDRFSGSIEKVGSLADLASLMELLLRDDRFFVATQNLFASFHNHWFCLTCALTPKTHRAHANDEHSIWEFAKAIPRMEAAIVQATRTVEAILGKPGKNDQRVLDRWTEAITLDPDEHLGFMPISHLEYYRQLFDIRGEAAHSFGKLSVGMSRQLTNEAQCFASNIHRSYYLKHKVESLDAIKSLRFNRTLADSEPKDWSTVLTADDDNFRCFYAKSQIGQY